MPTAQPSTDPVTAYARDVCAGTILAGPRVRQACKRHLRDLEDGEGRGLRWSAEIAAYAISFTRFIRHSKGEWRGKPLELQPWQQFIVGCCFGWQARDENGAWRRRFRTAYVEVPKKNGKSTMCGFIGIYGLVGDGEPGAEVYAAATAKQQAMIVFNEAREMVRSSPQLREQLLALVRNISHEASYSKFEPISSDENTGDGINPHFAIFDELHRLKNRGLMTVLAEGMGARRQPMLWIITTAGDDRQNTAYDDEHNYACKVVEGALTDDTYFAYIACPDEDDPWDNQQTWLKANPSLGISIKMSDMVARAAKARNSPGDLAEFKRYRLNIRSSDTAAAIKMETWRLNTAREKLDEEALAGRRCRTAIDLSAKQDISCLVHLFPPEREGERWVILPRFWVPEEGVAERASRDRVPYQRWIDEGFIRATPGNRVDYRAIFDQLKADAEVFNPVDVTFDPWNAGTLEADCQDAGMSVMEFPQNTAHYAHPTKEFLGMLPDGLFEHFDNPVLAWMASNLTLVKDHNDNPMPSKKKSTGRIDGIAGTIMALGRALAEDETNVSRGILVI